MDLSYTITQAKVPLSRTIEAERQREPMKQNVTEFFLCFFSKNIKKKRHRIVQERKSKKVKTEPVFE